MVWEKSRATRVEPRILRPLHILRLAQYMQGTILLGGRNDENHIKGWQYQGIWPGNEYL